MNQSDPFGSCEVNSSLKPCHLVKIEDLGPNNVVGSNLDTLSTNYTCSKAKMKPKHVLFSLISIKNKF